MPMHTTNTLYDELSRALIEVDKQIKHVKEPIRQSYPEEKRDRINVWYWTFGQDGKPILSDLLCARAQILNGMAVLKAATVKGR
jgi:hypothetical protein